MIRKRLGVPLKAARKGSREAEIGMYGHPIVHHRVHKSKKQYDRKIAKARLKKEGEPLFLFVRPGMQVVGGGNVSNDARDRQAIFRIPVAANPNKRLPLR